MSSRDLKFNFTLKIVSTKWAFLFTFTEYDILTIGVNMVVVTHQVAQRKLLVVKCSALSADRHGTLEIVMNLIVHVREEIYEE